MMAGIVSASIFVVTLYLILTEKMNRAIAAMLGAGAMVAAGVALGFYTEEMAADTIDFETLGLLFGMMVLVALLEPTGFFQSLAIWAARLSRGNPVRLLVLLGTVTTVLSLFLDNVTTVVLIAPVTILISEILGINPTPLLVAEALLSNTGGVGTLVGDPPNVLIASAAGFSFDDFLTHALPVVLIVWLVALVLLRYLFRQDLVGISPNADVLLDLNPAEALTDRKTAERVVIVLGLAILMFLTDRRLGVSPAFIALAAASMAMAWVQPPLREMLQRVEWSVLLFFVALFVMVGGLDGAGLLDALADIVAQFGGAHPVLFGLALMWVVACLSALVDNIPITIALIPVIQGLGEAGVNTQPLWWALAFGAGLGGNGTIIGSTANVVVASVSERTHAPITSTLWNRRGLPVMLATLAVTSVLYALFYPYLAR